MTGWYNSSWRARFLEYRKEGDGWSHPLLLCDKTHRRRTMMSGDDRQNSPSISRQNRPSATLFRCLYAPRHTAYKTKKIIFIWKYGGREYCSKSEKPPPAKRCFFCGLFNKRLGAVEFVLSYRFGRFLICSRLLGHWCRAPPLPICFPQKTNRR